MPSGSGAAAATPSPPPSRSSANAHIASTQGRIGLFQVFDDNGARIAPAQVDRYAPRLDAVWGSVEAPAWKAANPRMLVSQYFIMGMDRASVTHRSLAWWKANHPDWILYACTAGGAPTHDIAYMPGIGTPDMPIDIHNPAAVDSQIRTMADAAKSGGYNALAIDQVVFWNTYRGGNPAFGQRPVAGEYGCGVWHGGTFVRRYASPKDPQWTSDVVAYVREAHKVLQARGMTLIVNHPAGNISDPNEQAILANTDLAMDETGFSDYGRYTQDSGSNFRETLAWMHYGQAHGTGMLLIDKFVNNAHPTQQQLEYSIATYLLANDGAALLFAGGKNDYGTIQFHPEYDAPIGTACGAVSGGPHVYWRSFSGGLAVVNAGTAPQTFPLPSGKSYRDLEGRPVEKTLSLRGNDAYVLLAAARGC